MRNINACKLNLENCQIKVLYCNDPIVYIFLCSHYLRAKKTAARRQMRRSPSQRKVSWRRSPSGGGTSRPTGAAADPAALLAHPVSAHATMEGDASLAGQGGRKQRAEAAIADHPAPPHAAATMLIAMIAALLLPLLDARATVGGSPPNRTERMSAADVTPRGPVALLTRCSGSAAVELVRATARENQVMKTGTGRHLGAPL